MIDFETLYGFMFRSYFLRTFPMALNLRLIRAKVWDRSDKDLRGRLFKGFFFSLKYAYDRPIRFFKLLTILIIVLKLDTVF